MADSHSLWTFADAVEHVIDSATGTTGDSEMTRKARRAVLDAYREFPLRDEWGYFIRRGHLVTDASQSTGTVAYDHTGGTYERQLTLTDATWPTNARYGIVRIAEIEYFIETRESDTIVTLRRDSNPGSDVASGTSYEYYRNVYPVPLEYRAGSMLIDFDQSGRVVQYVSPVEFMSMQAVNGDPQDWAQAYTIQSAGDDYDTMSICLTPPPKTSSTFNYVYHKDPRPLNIYGSAAEYSTGTISVSGTTVTGSSTVFEERMIGDAIRFPASGTSTVPTGSAGAYGNDNPYYEYRVVTAVASTTELTIDQSLSGAYSDVKYTIGSPLDLDYHVMLDAFLALCEWKFSMGTKQEYKVVDAREGAWLREYRRARGRDYRGPVEHRSIPMPRYWQVYSGEPMG